MHMQRRVYTLAEILNKIFVKKIPKENWGPYIIYDHGLTN